MGVKSTEVDETIWDATAPTTQNVNLPETLGFWFEMDAPGILAGFRQYSVGTHPDFCLFQLWDSSDVLVAQMARTALQTALTPAGGAGWRNTWLKPRVALAASTPYLVVMYATTWSVTFGAVASAPYVNGHFTVYANGASPNPGNGIYDAVTDSGGRWNFTVPPTDATSGHMYAVDVLVRFD